MFAIAHDAIATIVRPTSVVAFGAELLAVPMLWTYRSTTAHVPPPSFFGQLRFWFNEGDELFVVAIGCVVAYGVLGILRRWCPGEKLKSTGWCLWLNITTIVLPVF